MSEADLLLVRNEYKALARQYKKIIFNEAGFDYPQDSIETKRFVVGFYDSVVGKDSIKTNGNKFIFFKETDFTAVDAVIFSLFHIGQIQYYLIILPVLFFLVFVDKKNGGIIVLTAVFLFIVESHMLLFSVGSKFYYALAAQMIVNILSVVYGYCLCRLYRDFQVKLRTNKSKLSIFINSV